MFKTKILPSRFNLSVKSCQLNKLLDFAERIEGAYFCCSIISVMDWVD